MFDRRFRLAAIAIALAAVLAGSAYGAEQTPRQAVIEMLSGGEASFKKHLTLEMQGRLQDLMKPSLDNAPNPLQALLGANSRNNLQAFDMGPILFSLNNSQEHERYELQIDSELPGTEEDTMALSLHLMRSGVEQEMASPLRVNLNMKKQGGIWRLNEVTFTTTLSVGDPRFLEKSWWTPLWLVATGGSADSKSEETPTMVDDRPKLTPLRSVRMIAMAENIYAQQHPGTGFTCRLTDLVNVGKGMDEEGLYRFIDTDLADGLYNGYRFALSGCERKPAHLFRIIAEPVAGKGRAYCSDSTNNLRASEDGRGSTCLAAGKIARR